VDPGGAWHQNAQVLDHLGVAYKGVNVLESDDIRNGIKAYSNWPTIPQLYVKGEFVGGCDIVRNVPDRRATGPAAGEGRGVATGGLILRDASCERSSG